MSFGHPERIPEPDAPRHRRPTRRAVLGKSPHFKSCFVLCYRVIVTRITQNGHLVDPVGPSGWLQRTRILL